MISRWKAALGRIARAAVIAVQCFTKAAVDGTTFLH